MSDIDPVLEHLRCRRAFLLRQIDDANARIDEIDTLITTLADGRHRIAKRRKASTDPAALRFPDPNAMARALDAARAANTEPEEAV